MRLANVFIIVALLLGCASPPGQSGLESRATAKGDPIARLVERLAASRLWRNGLFPILDLPATASTDQVIARVFERTGFDEGHVKQYRVLETRQVHIPGDLPDMYTASVVETDLGNKIVLLKYRDGGATWWSRVYDPEPSG